MKKGPEIFQAKGNTDQEMRFSFEQTPEPVSTQYLHDTYEYIPMILLHELLFIEWRSQFFFHAIHIIFQQTMFPGFTEFGLCLPEHRCHIILQGTLHATLVVDKMNFFIFNQNIPALKIPEHEIFIFGIPEFIRKSFEICDELFLIIRKLQGIEKIILKIKQVAHDSLPAKFTGCKTPVFIIQPLISLYLQMRQFFKALPEKPVYMVIRSFRFQMIK